MTAYRTYFRLLFSLAPEQAAKKAFSVFATPRLKTLRERERNALTQATAEPITVNNTAITRYRWGKSDRKVLLVHGWEGNGGSMGYFVQPLVDQGYEVVSFDGPAHHQSPQRQTNLFDFSKVVYELVKQEKPETIVAHSFGCGATTLALYDHATEHPVKNLVIMGTPDKLADIVQDFTTLMGFSDKNRIRMLNHISQRFGRSVYAVELSEYLRFANVRHILAVHDYNDRIVPHANSVAVAQKNPAAELMTIHKVGHYKMLWDPAVQQKVIEFIVNQQ